MRSQALSTDVAATRASLLRAARAKLRNPAWAEDAVSETLLAALESGPPHEHPAQMHAWLFGVLTHKIVDQIRRHGSARLVVAASELPDQALPELAAPPHLADPFHLLAGRQFVRALDQAMDALPARQATAVLLTDILGASSGEVCAELRVSRENLWVMLHRGRKQLCASLEAHAQA